MGMTITEKIFADHIGREVKPGEIITNRIKEWKIENWEWRILI